MPGIAAAALCLAALDAVEHSSWASPADDVQIEFKEASNSGGTP